MPFADISYFGDGGTFGGSPAWSGRVTSASQLDSFDWGMGRKAQFSSMVGGMTSFEMDRLIDDAIRRKNFGANRTGDLLRDYNRKDNSRLWGESVEVAGMTDLVANGREFRVDGATANSQYPMASRIAFDRNDGSLYQYTRNLRVTGQGRVVGIGAEHGQKINIEKKPFYFYLENDSETGTLMIRMCRVFLGCLGNYIKCDDVAVDLADGEVTYYAHVDFTDVYPVLTVDDNDDGYEEYINNDSRSDDSTDKGIFTFPLHRFKNGGLEYSFSGMVILPTYTFIGSLPD